MSSSSPVLVVTDSDGDEVKTRDTLNRGIELENWIASIPDPEIESWLSMGRGELRKTIRKSDIRKELSLIVDKIDLEELAESNSSFKVFYDWVKNA